MTEKRVTFVCGVDASEKTITERLLWDYDAVLLCCGAGEPCPLELDIEDISRIYYGMEYPKSDVEQA